MSKIRLDVSVGKNGNIADQLRRRIEDGMEEAAKPRRPESLGQQMVGAAKEHIRRHGKVWTTELISSFDIDAASSGDNVVLIVRNDAGHAAAIDTGATYGDEGPPLHRLIPWVESKMKGYRIEGGRLVQYGHDDGGKTILTDGSGKRQGATIDLPPDTQVQEVQTLDEAGIEPGVNAESSYRVRFEDGEYGFFQEYIDPDGPITPSVRGTVKNEQLFTEISSINDWRVGPESRDGSIIDPSTNEIINGNFMRWVDNSDHVLTEISSPGLDDDDLRWTPPEFLEEFNDQMARMTVLDIILGNDDRHAENMRVTINDEFHAIDNGGNRINFGDGLDNIIPYASVVMSTPRFRRFEDYPELETQYQSLFDTQIELLTDLLENEAENILQRARRIHGSESQVYDRLERLFGYDTEEIIAHIEDHHETMFDINLATSDDVEQALLDADSLDDFQDGILGDIADELDDL